MAPSLLTPVGQLRPNVLPILASWIAEVGLPVEIDARSARTATAVVEPRVLVVHPERCTILGLLLAARVLSEAVAADRAGAPLPRRVTSRARASLIRRVPALHAVPRDLWARAFGDDDGPAVRRTHATLTQAPEWVEHSSDQAVRSSSALPGIDLELVLSDAQFDGAPSAIDELLASIRAGRRRLHTLPDFPDVPFVVAQVRVNTAPRQSDDDGSLAPVESLVQSYARCVRQSAEGLPLAQPPEASAFAGARLDPRPPPPRRDARGPPRRPRVRRVRRRG